MKAVTLPKHTRFHIDWNEDGKGGRAYIIVGYCPDTLAYFKEMAKALTWAFPDIPEDEIVCGKIHKSDCIQGFTIVIANTSSHKRELASKWTERKVDFNY